MTPGNSDIMTSAGVGLISIIAGASKSAQWYDLKTGQVVWPIFFSGIATCLIMASIVRAGGVHYGVEPWVQVMLSGVLCYVGPDPIIRAVAKGALNRFGVKEDDNAANGKSP